MLDYEIQKISIQQCTQFVKGYYHPQIEVYFKVYTTFFDDRTETFATDDYTDVNGYLIDNYLNVKPIETESGKSFPNIYYNDVFFGDFSEQY